MRRILLFGAQILVGQKVMKQSQINTSLFHYIIRSTEFGPILIDLMPEFHRREDVAGVRMTRDGSDGGSAGNILVIQPMRTKVHPERY